MHAAYRGGAATRNEFHRAASAPPVFLRPEFGDEPAAQMAHSFGLARQSEAHRPVQLPLRNWRRYCAGVMPVARLNSLRKEERSS